MFAKAGPSIRLWPGRVGMLARWEEPDCTPGRGRWVRLQVKIISQDFCFQSQYISTRNDCEMTHFFFSLIREPAIISERTERAPLMFYFDTHIITQVNLNVKHTVFDKVLCTTDWPLTAFNGPENFIVICHWWNARPLLWTFRCLAPGVGLLSSPLGKTIGQGRQRRGNGGKLGGRE